MRHIPLLLALLALPFLLLACRGDGGLSSFSADALRSAPERAAEEGTFQFEFKMTIEADDMSSGDGLFDAFFGDGMAFVGEGAVDLDNDRIYTKMNIIFMEMESIQDGTTCYSRSDWFGDKWQRDENCTDNFFGDDEFFFGEDPASFFEVLREMGDEVEDLGTDTVRGVDTRHYRVTVHDREFEELTGMPGIPVDLWVDGEGRPMRMLIEMEMDEEDEFMGGEDGKVRVSLDFTFFDWGQPVDIPIPSEDEIEDMDFFGGWDDEDWEWDDEEWEWDSDDDWDWPWDDEDS